MKSNSSVVAVIFSKDRAMQLDACLRSFALHCRDFDQCRPSVIYTTSHERSEKQYEILRRSYRGVAFVREESFHSDLIRSMEGSSYVLFLVDDNLFVREWSLSEVVDALTQNQQAIGFSLRLGPNISFSYSLNKRQKLPEFISVAPNVLKFSWATAEHDFGYPLEVSSSLYRVEDILSLIKAPSTITNPNSWEAFLEANKDHFRKTQGDLLCFATSVSFCNPVNIVRIDWLNRSRDNYEESVYALMRKFDLGYRIDLRPFHHFVPNACHQEVDLTFLTPRTEWTTLSAAIEVKSSRGESAEISECLEAVKDIAASSVLRLSDLSERDRERVCQFLYLLKSEGASSDWLLGVLRMFDELTHDELMHFQSMIIALKDKLAEANRLKEEWYEPELARLKGELLPLHRELLRLNRLVAEYEPELTHLRGEMGRPEHRLIRRVRQGLKNRFPWLFYFVRYLVQRAPVLWRDRTKISEAMSAIVNTRVVFNRGWPMEHPLVSVIIASFNYGKYLPETIDSVLTQTFQDFEIIIIDDGSTDPYTREILATLSKPKTRLIIQENQGLPKTRNNGIAIARGKYICCLDSDDCLKPTYLEKCIYQLETRNFDVCFSWVQTFGESSFLWQTGPFLIDVLMSSNLVSVSAVFKKALWQRVGGYKEAMTHGYDDWEFWLTLAEQGAVGYCIPEPLLLHRKHPTSMSAGRRHRYDEIVEHIKSLHPQLYREESEVKKIRKRQKRTFRVINPTCNLFRHPTIGSHRPDNQIRILLATPWFDLGGASVIKKDVFSHLVKEGVRVTAIAATLSDGAHTENGLQLYETITDDCFDLPRFLDEERRLPFVEYLIKSRGIQLLYLAGSRAIYEMLPALKKAFPDLRVIDELYNVVGHVGSNREFSRFIDLNIVVNEEIRERLIALGESEERIQVITPGIDADHFCRDNPICSEAAAQRPYKQFTFGFLGRLSPEKRPQDFVRLASLLPSCQFRIAGDGPLTSLVEQEIIAQDISAQCHFEGCTSNPAGFLSGIDALVITSEVEGLPLVLLEAMALELPVITTGIGGIPQVVVHGRNGFLYKPSQLDELVSLASALSRMPVSDRSVIGRSARETVLSKYTISTCAANYLAVFTNLTGLISHSHRGEDVIAAHEKNGC